MCGKPASSRNRPETDLETWFIRGGSAGAALYTFKQPGIYAYVNHNLIEAVELGAAAHFKVEGKWNDDLMKPGEGAGTDSAQGAGRIADPKNNELRLRRPARSAGRCLLSAEALPCCSHPTSRSS